MHQDVVFGKQSSDNVFFCLFVLFSGVSSGFPCCLDKSPVRMSTGLESSFNVVLFLFLPFCLRGNVFGPVVWSSNDRKFVFQFMVRFEQKFFLNTFLRLS
ncbi:hypothetical protein AMECASPLE_030295 [Ameca splendens]|uniref:Secreted protein n=1 Tax=Ameca splendens TaxID=208324 RepID=A0ABV0ZQU9_9TELE